MKVSLKWLRTMVEVPEDLRAFSEKLDLTGTEVDGIEETGSLLENIVVGHILKREHHPDADTLWVTTVDVGNHNLDEEGNPAPLHIVCGAQNFDAGDKVPVALVGAVLPDGTKIKKSKLRGVVSMGMNCSARELGLGTDHDGIMILPEDAPVGAAFSAYRGLSDTVLDLEVTPNRPDCMSMLGIAREVAAIYDNSYDLGKQIAQPEFKNKAENLVNVSIDDAARCSRYTARVIQGVKIGPSPEWLAERVVAAGARSINNIVDVTNYIMFETGQPLHAFDLDTLAQDASGKASIVVRAAGDGSVFTTLDDVERKLSSDITVIADGNAEGGKGKTIALAGVMGGLESEVTENTVNILLESASFDSGHTSRTSRNLKLFSESSARYERGVDEATCDEFGARAAALMAEVGGGTVAEGVIDCYPNPRRLPELTLNTSRMRTLIGAEIPDEDACAILARLGCSIEPLDAATAGEAEEAGSYRVLVPSYRPDLEREVDLYEEILRIWGMDRVPSRLPGGEGRIGSRTRNQMNTEKLCMALRSSGLNETMTYSFASADDCELLRMPLDESIKPVELINPLSSEHAQMRMSIIPGLLRSVAYNQSHGVSNIQLFEQGAVYHASEDKQLPKEKPMIAAVLAGSWHEQGWNEEARSLDFFDAKGIIENVARELCIPKLRFVALDPTEAPWLADGQAAEIRSGSAVLGWLGTVHPLAANAFGAKAPVIAFELELKHVLSAAKDAREFVPVPVYPAVELDLAIVVDMATPAEKLLQVARSAGGKLLEEVRIFDVFVDEEKLGANKKSVALAFSYRSAERTLTSEEIEKLHGKVVQKLEGATGGEVRS